jgi:PBP1b-binding outer membrane lipoprotein LpoB
MGRITILLVGIGCAAILASGCSNTDTVYPVTSGSHTPITPADVEKTKTGPKTRIIIQADDPGIVSALTTFFLRAGLTLVERSQLDKVLDEQATQQSLIADNQARLIQAGKIIGADRLVIAEHTSTGAPYYNLSVSVRGIEIESGKVRWSGTAAYQRQINNPGMALSYLATSAVARALCATELGYQWNETTSFTRMAGTDGCRKSG